MTDELPVTAKRWKTPFEQVHPYRLHLLRVSYETGASVNLGDGSQYDFSERTVSDGAEIFIFSEDEQVVYRIYADVISLRIHDEVDLPNVTSGPTGASFRMTGSDLHRSVGSITNGDSPSYCIATGWDCVEFICVNPPRVEAVGVVKDSRETFN